MYTYMCIYINMNMYVYTHLRIPERFSGRVAKAGGFERRLQNHRGKHPYIYIYIHIYIYINERQLCAHGTTDKCVKSMCKGNEGYEQQHTLKDIYSNR